MRNIEYEIKYEENGKPYIHLENTKMEFEDMFFCFEIVRYRLFGLLNDEKNSELPPEALGELAVAGNIIDELSNKIGSMISESNNTLDSVNDILNKK